ncbi:MAG: hypothetical protein JHC34_00300 [Acidobacteria bacterium]|nr:hypothetical protein [Acidobacteriota bacterium]
MADGMIHSHDRLGVLLKLHLLLTWRPPKRGGLKEVAGAFAMVFFAGITGLAIAATSLGLTYVLSDRPAEQDLVFWGGAGFLLLFFLLMGLFMETVAGGIDISLLFHYPITHPEMLLSELGARVVGPASLPAAGFFAGCAAGGLLAGRKDLALAALPALLIWLVQANLAMMTIDYLLFHVRRSRHIQEAFALVGMLLYISLLLLPNILPNGHGGQSSQSTTLSMPEWFLAAGKLLAPLAALLPGASAASWIVGGWAMIPRMGFALALILSLFLADQLLLQRLIDSGGVETPGANARRAVKRNLTMGRSKMAQFLAWPFFVKELRYMVRDPVLRNALLGVVIFPFVILYLLIQSSGIFAGAWFSQYGFQLFLLMGFARLSTNHLAVERSGLGLLLGSPAPRWAFLMGKNLAMMALFILVLLVPTGYLFWKGMPAPDAGISILIGIAAGAVYFGIANVTSILIPLPVVPRGHRLMPQGSGGMMFLLGLLNLVALTVTWIAILPLLLWRLAVSQTAAPETYLLLAVGIVLYGLLLYLVLLALASRLMERRESTIYEALVRRG